ncbi:hypothetical protein KJ815_06995, partial [bacterium]|nr:hypothetical protein [bacterium]
MTQAPITSPADSPITAWIELPPDARRFGTQFVFARPIEVWQADEITDVRSALTRVAQAQSAGFYVAGFVTYEASPAFDSALVTPSRSPLPLAWFAAFREPTECLPPPAVALPPPSEPVLLTTEAEYSQSVRRALEHIRAGDIYQVNYTVRADLD